MLRLLPKGTHDARAFIQPAELAYWARQDGLRINNLTGMHYNPINRSYSLGGNTQVNYLMHAVAMEAE